MSCIKEIQAEDQHSFVVIDDRKTIHEVYKKSLAQKEIQFFESSQDFEKWLSEKGVDKNEYFFLVDFDLGKSSKDGVSIIEDNSLKSKAVLISNHYDDMSLLQLCEREKTRFIPKLLMGEYFI